MVRPPQIQVNLHTQGQAPAQHLPLEAPGACRMLQQHPTNPDQSVWLPGAAFNVAWAALTTPRGGCHASKRAIVWADEGSPGHIGTMSVGQLREGALRVAAAVRQLVPQGEFGASAGQGSGGFFHRKHGCNPCQRHSRFQHAQPITCSHLFAPAL